MKRDLIRTMRSSADRTHVRNGGPNPRTDVSGDLVRDGLLTVVEAAAFLRVSRSTLYVLMDRGALVYVKIGTARRIPRRALIDVAVANLQGGFQSRMPV